MTHIYTCECGEVFRDKNGAVALERWLQHRDENYQRDLDLPHHDMYTFQVLPATPVVPPEPAWRPADAP